MSAQYIESKDTKQESFAQAKPHFVCQNRGRFRTISETKGHAVKCRDPRCSLACLDNWSQRERRTIEHFLETFLPREHVVFRGNLTMQKGADPSAHKQARAAFLRAVKRRCPALQIRAQMHCTSHREAHYDFTAYAPSDLDVVQIVKEAWSIAGGKRATCRPLGSEDEETAWAAYQSKGRPSDSKGWRFVPLSKREGGLDLTFGTRGFFGGRSADEVYADWVATVFPKRFRAVFMADQWGAETGVADPILSESDTESTPITIRKIVSPTPPPSAPSEPPSAESAWASLHGDRSEVEYHAGSLTQERLGAFEAAYPGRLLVVPVTGTYTAPDPDIMLRSDIRIAVQAAREPMGLAELAERIGWPMVQVRAALKDLHNYRLDYHLTADGRMVREAVFYQPHPPCISEQPIARDSVASILPA